MASLTPVQIIADPSPIMRWQPSESGDVIGPGIAITLRFNAAASCAVRSAPDLNAA